MNILLTGGAGYLGSVLIPHLLSKHHRVRVVDIGYFGISHINPFLPYIEFIREDIRRVYKDKKFREDIVEGCNCIIHLAAISNDPSAELYPELTEQINIKATEALAEIAKIKKIKFIFASSCSVYGATEGVVKEDSSLNPLSLYALSKVKCEEMLNSISTESWRALILRSGTLFGFSPRMRFDLVVNLFSLHSSLYNEIKLFGKGREWRPFLHVKDCARAIVYFAEKKELRYNCYNLAYKNMQIKDIAEIFKKLNPSIKIVESHNGNIDRRNYCVAIERMKEEGFLPQQDIITGAKEVIEAIEKKLIPEPESLKHFNVKWLKGLVDFYKDEKSE